MNMQFPKILSKFLLFLRPNVLEILAAENNHSTLRNQQSQLVLLCITELAQLETLDFGSDSGSKVYGRDIWIIGCKEVRLGFVG
jgi:hypothetical protein